MTGRVSILIPCYNLAHRVERAIESALQQTYLDKEVIVVDDGSTDRSLDVIKSFGSLIRWTSTPNRGGNAARNQLLGMASGEWLQYLDADDYLLPTKIEEQLDSIGRSEEADILFSPVIVEEENDGIALSRMTTPMPAPHDPWILLVRWFLPQTGGALWKRKAIQDVGGWSVNQPCCQEHELYLRLLMAGKQFQFCPSAGAVYCHWSEDTVSRRNSLQTIDRRLDIVSRAERALLQERQLTEQRMDAIAFVRHACARVLYPLDRASAKSLCQKAVDAHPHYRLPADRCFPKAYRTLRRCIGFQASETVGIIKRAIWNPNASSSS